MHQNPTHHTSKGGAALFIKHELSTHLSVRTDLNLDLPLVEDIWVEINNTIISVIYKHPKAKNIEFTEKLEKSLEIITSGRKRSIVCGDINLNLINISQPDTQMYADMLLRNNFIPTITLPTRITDHSLTLIDHICLHRPLNEVDCPSSCGNIFFDISDHLPNFILIEGNEKKLANRPYIRVYSERNINKFQRMLHDSNWNNVLNCEDANIAYEKFAEMFSDAFNTSFPLIQQSRKSFKDKKWITPALRVSIKHKNRLYKKYLTRPNPYNKASYKSYKNKLLSTIEHAKKAYYSGKLTSDKAKLNDIWKIYSELLGRCKDRQSTEISKLIHNGQTHTSSSAIANAFNQYFSTIGANLAQQHNSSTSHKTYLNQPLTYNMFVAPICSEVLIEGICNG
jgi:hypothetical protein